MFFLAVVTAAIAVVVMKLKNKPSKEVYNEVFPFIADAVENLELSQFQELEGGWVVALHSDGSLKSSLAVQRKWGLVFVKCLLSQRRVYVRLIDRIRLGRRLGELIS